MTGSTVGDRGSPRRAGRPLISPLLRAGSGASQADRDKLVYTVGGRMAVLVELDVGHGITVARNCFTQLFAAAFAGQQVTEPVPIARRYLRCLLTRPPSRPDLRPGHPPSGPAAHHHQRTFTSDHAPAQPGQP